MADEENEKDDIAASEATADEADTKADEVEGQESGDDGIEPEEGIKQLKRSVEDQKKRLEEAEQRRVAAEQAAYQAKLQVQRSQFEARSSNLHEINARLGWLDQRQAVLKQAWNDARSMGDYDKELEIQQEFTRLENDRRVFAQGKDRIEHELRQPVQPVAPPEIDPVEGWASQMEQSGLAAQAAWLRGHKSKLKTQEDLNLVASAHHKAKSDGLREGSREYFDYIEEEMGFRQPRQSSRRRDDDDEDEAPAPRSRRSAPPPSAPVSRGGDRKGTFRLNAEQREIAKMCGQTEEEYYAQLKRAEKDARAG
jgi:hypothetical protein